MERALDKIFRLSSDGSDLKVFLEDYSLKQKANVLHAHKLPVPEQVRSTSRISCVNTP